MLWCFRWQIDSNGDNFLSFLVMFWAVNTMKLHYKAPQLDNCHKVVPFLLTHIVLFVRIMCDCAEICKLCDWMRFLINYAGLHHCTILEPLFSCSVAIFRPPPPPNVSFILYCLIDTSEFIGLTKQYDDRNCFQEDWCIAALTLELLLIMCLWMGESNIWLWLSLNSQHKQLSFDLCTSLYNQLNGLQ